MKTGNIPPSLKVAAARKESPRLQQTFILRNRNGLHARPCALLVKTLRAFQCDITVECRSQLANAQTYTGSFTIPKINSDTTVNVEIWLEPVVIEKPKVLAINGTVTNKKTGEPVEAKLSITHKVDKAVSFSSTALGGDFSQTIPKTGWYMFTASREGFLNAMDSLNYDNKDVTPMTKNIVMQPIEVGLTVRLKNIYFDYNKATLKSESFVELDKVVAFMNQNPTVEIEIEGHTDSDGPDDRNQTLSQNRSQSVVDYIASKGVNKARMQAKGFGESKPIDTNETPEGRANNRRVEFTVLKT